MPEQTDRYELTLPADQNIFHLDIVMSFDGSRWNSKPKCRVRDDVMDWAAENKIHIYVQYPFDERTVLFESESDAMLFKLTWL